jgi:hypothetical protein
MADPRVRVERVERWLEGRWWSGCGWRATPVMVELAKSKFWFTLPLLDPAPDESTAAVAAGAG